ncbi:MAG: hypothetical protein AB1420_06765 [Bacillota bacterium]
MQKGNANYPLFVKADGDAFFGLLADTGTSVANLGMDVVQSAGVKIYAITALAQGAIVTSVLWGAILAYIIDRNYKSAGIFALVASFFAYIGFIHAPVIKLGAALNYAGWYLVLAVLLGIFHWRGVTAKTGLPQSDECIQQEQKA